MFLASTRPLLISPCKTLPAVSRVCSVRQQVCRGDSEAQHSTGHPIMVSIPAPPATDVHVTSQETQTYTRKWSMLRSCVRPHSMLIRTGHTELFCQCARQVKHVSEVFCQCARVTESNEAQQYTYFLTAAALVRCSVCCELLGKAPTPKGALLPQRIVSYMYLSVQLHS